MQISSIYERQVDALKVIVHPDRDASGCAAAAKAKAAILAAVNARGEANLILATGNSQLSFLAVLRGLPEIPWRQVNIFHMDEYLGIGQDHPASFPRFLQEYIIRAVQPKSFFPIDGLGDPQQICREYLARLRVHPSDLCVLGIGENGHLAFNDPPAARFDDPDWVRVVTLEESCRRQQVGEGHFRSIDKVPLQAITLTIPALLAARVILAVVPELRKAAIVRRTLLGPVEASCPASILRRTAHACLFLDPDSASEWLSAGSEGE